MYSSVAFEFAVEIPANAKAEVCIPAPARISLAVIKLPPAVQADPSYSSVAPVSAVSNPPNASPAVCIPAPAKLRLAVPKFPPAAQEVPSYSSVAFEFVVV